MATENSEQNKKKSQGINLPFIITTIVLLVISGVFVYLYIQSSGAISQKDATITSLQNQVSALNSNVTALQNKLAAAPSPDQLAAAQKQIDTAFTNINDLQNQVNGLQSQVNTLTSNNSQLQDIVNMTLSKVEGTSVTVHELQGNSAEILKFKADYAGYIAITATSSSDKAFLVITDDNSNYPDNSTKYSISNGGTFNVMVLPGTVAISAGNTDTIYEVNVTISVTYYY